MTCFFPWFALENPRLAEHINISRRKKGLHDLIIEQPADKDRVQFLDRELPALIASIIAGEGLKKAGVGRKRQVSRTLSYVFLDMSPHLWQTAPNKIKNGQN